MIWYLRGYEKAISFVAKHAPFCITALTYLELIQGMRNKRELAAMEKVIADGALSVIAPNESDMLQAVVLMKAHALSHSLDPADAINVAVTIARRETIATSNIKHYGCISGLSIEAYKP
jgi:predicted nucleic acid-binding protein